jgi:hypothetical protein
MRYFRMLKPASKTSFDVHFCCKACQGRLNRGHFYFCREFLVQTFLGPLNLNFHNPVTHSQQSVLRVLVNCDLPRHDWHRFSGWSCPIRVSTFRAQDEPFCFKNTVTCVGHIARLRRVGERPSAAWTFAIKSIDECPECLWLWQSHNGLERQRIAVRVMPIGDAADRMSEDFD